MGMRLPRTARLAVATGAVLLPFLAVPATAAPGASAAAHAAPATATQPKARIDLVIHQGGADGSVLAQTVLACMPVGGSHPSRSAACSALRRAGADFRAISPAFGACPTVSSPVTVTAHGFWKNKAVSFEKSYPNRCLAERATGAVFRF